MNPSDVFTLAITAIITGSFVVVLLAWRFFRFREKRLEVDARLTAEKAAQYAASNAQLEQRLRVLEQIVTDGGAQTAAQIEALRAKPLPTREKSPQESLD